MKDKIIKMKNDKSILNLYVKCFLEGKKTREKLSNNDDYNKLMNKF